MRNVANAIWDCRQAKAEIALQAGGDAVDPATSELLQSHLGECRQCRIYLAEMTASLEALQACALQWLPASQTISVWPGVAARLPASIRPTAAARFNVWVPTAAMSVACAAMWLVTIVQLGRVSQFEPTATPQFQTVFEANPDRETFDHLGFPAERRQPFKDPMGPGSLPVRFKYEREW